MKVKVITGMFGDIPVANQVLTLLKKGDDVFRYGMNGMFVLVDGTGSPDLPQRRLRIHLKDKVDIVLNYDESNPTPVEIAPPPLPEEDGVSDVETYEQVKDRITERFEALKHFTRSICDGSVRGMIVSGPPGIGKTFEVERVFRDVTEEDGDYDDTFDEDPSKIGERFSIISGRSTAAALYELLHDHRHEGKVLAIDDCDAVFYDDDALNLLKAAMDTSERRVVSWRVSSSAQSALPSSFEFQGSVIVLTNLDIAALIAKDNRLSKHLDAIQDRCLILDLDMHNSIERLARIEHVCSTTPFLSNRGLDKDGEVEVFEYFKQNVDNFNGITMRRIVQLADIYKAGGNWKRMAEITLFRKKRK